ncbi:MAG: hypothetical protein WBW41_14705, partial [Verrucomicrobiia bacterium]
MNLVTWHNLYAIERNDALLLAKIKLCLFGQVNRGIFAQWKNGDPEIAVENVRSMATQTDVEYVTVVKVVGNQLAIQRYAGDIADVMKTKNGIGAKVNAFRESNAPNRRLFKVRIKRSGRNGLFDFADGNFPRRPGSLQAFEGGFVFDYSRGRRSKALENAVGFAGEIAALERERSRSRINGHIEVSTIVGGQAQ